MSSSYLVPLIRHMTQTHTFWFRRLVNSPRWPAVTLFSSAVQISHLHSCPNTGVFHVKWLSFLGSWPVYFFEVFNLMPQSHKLHEDWRCIQSALHPPENREYCFCICYFLIGKPEKGARFTTRPWSPVDEMWTQEIAFFESEPYLIIEGSLAWCPSIVLSICNLFYRGRKWNWENERETKTLIEKGKCVIHQGRASCRMCSCW